MTKTSQENLKSYDSALVKGLPESQIEITASISWETCETFRSEALKSLNETVTVDGFRKGMVPENILITKVGESAIMQEIAELALSKAYLDIINDKKIDAIGKPSVTVTKLAKGNPLEFKAVTAIVPEVNLPDYKSISKKTMSEYDPSVEKVSDKDVDEAILKIRKAQASHEGHDHDKMSPEEHEKAIMDSLPEFNDEFVRGLGGDFKDIEDFKNKVREMIGEDKKDKAREKLRLQIADSLIEKTEVVLPEIMIESELNRTELQFESDIKKMGVTMDDYLKHAKKTIDDVRKEWKPHAEKKAKLQLILNVIAGKENLRATEEEIETEINHILKHYKDADRDNARIYADTVLTNEKVFQFLESSK